MEKEKFIKRNSYIIYAILFVIILILTGITITYAYFAADSVISETLGNVSATADCINISYTESTLESDTINLAYNYPISDEFALANIVPVTVTVTNNCAANIADVDYKLTITSLANETGFITPDKIRTNVKRTLYNEEETTLIESNYLSKLTKITSGATYTNLMADLDSREGISSYTNKTIYSIDETSIGNGETNTYKIYLWVDYYEGDTTHQGLNDNSTEGQEFAASISLYVNPSAELALNEGTILTKDDYQYEISPEGLFTYNDDGSWTSNYPIESEADSYYMAILIPETDNYQVCYSLPASASTEYTGETLNMFGVVQMTATGALEYYHIVESNYNSGSTKSACIDLGIMNEGDMLQIASLYYDQNVTFYLKAGANNYQPLTLMDYQVSFLMGESFDMTMLENGDIAGIGTATEAGTEYGVVIQVTEPNNYRVCYSLPASASTEDTDDTKNALLIVSGGFEGYKEMMLTLNIDIGNNAPIISNYNSGETVEGCKNVGYLEGGDVIYIIGVYYDQNATLYIEEAVNGWEDLTAEEYAANVVVADNVTYDAETNFVVSTVPSSDTYGTYGISVSEKADYRLCYMIFPGTSTGTKVIAGIADASFNIDQSTLKFGSINNTDFPARGCLDLGTVSPGYLIGGQINYHDSDIVMYLQKAPASS